MDARPRVCLAGPDPPHVTSPWPVQVVALNAVSCGSVLWQAGSAQRVTVIVKATLALAHNRLAWPVAPLPIVREDRHGPSGSLEAASEVAPYLPSVGVVLTGHAYAPGGQPIATMIARLAIYRGEARLLDKRLKIVGDRAPVPPWRSQPFQRMPLVYERAFGGPGVPENPVGVGAASSAAPALPNLLDPVQPTRPAGMGPISPRWPARQRLLGGAEPRGGEPQQAGPMAGFDWRYFHAAPPDQQLPFLHGDEWLVLDGLHPELPRVQTQLPAARALARRYPAGGGGQGQPVDLAADTLVIDVDRQICSIVWRGSFALERAEEGASIRVCAGLEMPGHPLSWPSLEQAAPSPHDRPSAPSDLGATLPVGGASRPSAPGDLGTTLPVGGASRSSAPVLPFLPSPAAQAQAWPAASAARESRPSRWSGATLVDEETRMQDPAELAMQLQAPLAPFALAPPGSPAQPAAPIPGAPWAPPEPALQPRPAALLRPMDESATALVGLDPPDAQEVVPETEDAPVPLRPSAAGSAGSTPAGEGAPPAVEAPRVVAAVEAPPAVAPRAADPPAAGVVAPPDPAGAAGAAPSAGAAAVDPADERLRAEVIARLRAGELLGGLELAHADLSGLDLSGASLSALDLQGASLRGSKLAGARLADAKLVGADLGGADLSGADLTRADLSRAVLEGARLDGATLHEAILASARGAGASLAAVTGARASFARGVWDSASFEGADLLAPNLSGASLGAARFTGASLPEARLDDARGAGAAFDRARLGNARAPSAELTGCSFQDAAAPGSVWQGAKLDGSRFAGADLTGADLSRTSCASSVFAGADLTGANLQRAQGNGADLEGARLTGADLRQARLAEARFDGASLGRVIAHRADLGGCRLVRADLSGANLRASRMRGADLSFARLDGADLRDAELDGANVYGASRQGAKLSKRDEARLVEVPPRSGDPGGEAAGS
ncbi:DUF2169 domain-containing protein [Sorangium sp. So ce394]|uniref:DUF2169 family type VI secretion system accessory protein n=1 Tax=Sorangium sp. So ce394 TaxID=3133310 RepID=UPI003F5BB2A8